MARFRKVLKTFIEDGTVTFVPWPYENCVKGMASGRYVQFDDPIDMRNDSYTLFFPPKPIAQTTALASCYSRYKRSSNYIMHIDVDEFVMLSPGLVSMTLPEFIDRSFNRYPLSPAINILPVIATDCSQVAITKNKRFDSLKHTYVVDKDGKFKKYRLPMEQFSGPLSPLPRLGTFQYVRLGASFESKLIMRTNAVRMFFVHYITELNSTKWSSRKIYTPFRRKIILVHFKPSDPLSRSVFGKILSSSDKDNEQLMDCFVSTRVQHLSYESHCVNGKCKNVTATMFEPNSFMHHKLSVNSTEVLVKNYLRRVQMINEDSSPTT
jgi:hypothetical protein